MVAISLVVCTRDRVDQLSGALQSLSKLELVDPWELVLVDNGSNDGTAELLHAFCREQSFPVVVESEPRPGLARARNRGLAVSHGEIVAFTDDDCYPQEDFLQCVLRCFRDIDRGFVGGRVLLFDAKDARIGIQESLESVTFPPRSYIRPGVIHGANFAFRRTALMEIGGFDESLGAGSSFLSAEDTDAMARMSASGWWGAYDPRPVVLHHHRRQVESEIARLKRSYEIGAGAYFAKCLLNPALRSKYVSAWGRALWRQSRRKSLWQIQGAARYLGGWMRQIVRSSQPIRSNR
jgi:glycosyltransferase involved in cell wall biosynthesis